MPMLFRCFRSAARPPFRTDHRAGRASPTRMAKFGILVVLVLSGCQLGELVNEPPVGAFSASVTILGDSAAAGSKAVLRREISITGSGSQVRTWRVTRAARSSWLSFSETSGSLPANVTVSLDPTGLSPGAYRDTIVVEAVGGTAAPLLIPVAFVIHPCVVEDLSLAVAVSDSLVASDCASPTAPDHFANLYRVSIPAGDSVSLLLTTEGFDGVIRIDSSTDGAGPTLAEEDECVVASIDVCLLYLLLPPASSHIVQVTTSAEDETGRFTLTVLPPQAPNAPTDLEQLLKDGTTPIGPGASVTDSTVVLTGLVSDTDPMDALTLEVELRPAGVAFESVPTAAAEAVPNGRVANAILTGLDDDTDYHWQARVMDQTGRSGPWTVFGPSIGATDFRISVPGAARYGNVTGVGRS